MLLHPASITSTTPPSLGEVDSALLGLTDSTTPTGYANYWTNSLGNDLDQASALNLFTLLESGGGIDLAHYL